MTPEKATDISFALSSANMVNNPNICIKDYGSTFACVCSKCMEEVFNKASNCKQRLYNCKHFIN